MPQLLKPQYRSEPSCRESFTEVHVIPVSAGPGRVQRWLVGYVERWEDDEDGFVSKNFLRAGWHLHDRDDSTAQHPISNLTYSPDDAFEDRLSAHPKQRSHMESARRAIAQLCNEGTFEQSPDTRSVRLPSAIAGDEDLTKRLTLEREYLKAHGQAASDDLLVAVTGNIVVIKLERRLTHAERMSFATRCIERGDTASTRVQHLVDYVATRHGISREHALGEAVQQAKQTLMQWREEDL